MNTVLCTSWLCFGGKRSGFISTF